MPFSLLGSLADIAYNEVNYQRSLENQQRLFAREDNAVQRRMEDLKKAGLNPLLAVGSPASSGMSSVHAGSTNFGANLGELNDYLKNNYEAIKEQQEIAVQNSYADLANKEATKDLLEAQKKEADVRVLKAIAETENVNQKTRESAYNLEKYEDAGVPTNSSKLGKIATEVLGSETGKKIVEKRNQILEKQAEKRKRINDNWYRFKESFKNKAMNKKDFENFLKNQYNY